MTELQKIKDLISENRLDEALSALDGMVAGGDADDGVLLQRGMLLWRLGRQGDAVNDYERALAVNPSNSAARTALEMSRDIFDFFNPDLLNP